MRHFSKLNDHQKYERIDNLAEVDQTRFWREIRPKRKRPNRSARKAIKFKENIVRDPSDIVSGWEDYFKSIYSIACNSEFDDHHKDYVESEVQRALSDDQ